MFLCTIYVPPSDSPYYSEEIFPHLHTQICRFQAQGKVLICGDLNARTGTHPDSYSESGNKHIFGQNFPRNTTNLPRHNSDPQINKNGRDLLQLCQSLGLYIVNGRFRGDSLGRPTFCSSLGTSTVDYMITDLDQLFLSSFIVKPLTPLSDHSQITVFMKRTETNSPQSEPNNLFNIKRKIQMGSRQCTRVPESYGKQTNSKTLRQLSGHHI